MTSGVASASSASVSIRRDAYGVPHVFAKSTYGLFYGFGYALAEDQLYQLELLKRTVRGRLAQVLGPTQLANDRLARRRYDIAALARQYGRLSAGDQAIFRGMADGISARIRDVLAKRSTLIPRGFVEADFLPEEWKPLDVIAIYEHSMVLRFSDLNAELDNLALLTRLRASLDARSDGPAQIFLPRRMAIDDEASGKDRGAGRDRSCLVDGSRSGRAVRSGRTTGLCAATQLERAGSRLARRMGAGDAGT